MSADSQSHDSKRVALVTGAARGIGKAIALRLARDGFAVAVNDIPSNAASLSAVVEELKALKVNALACIADVSVEHEVQNMIEQVVAYFPVRRLDVMVANAGVLKWNPLVEMAANDWDTVMTVNARGTFLCYKYAAMQMIKQGGGGRIVGAASTAAKRGMPGLVDLSSTYAKILGVPSLGAYCASKFAIRGLTQSAAHELGPHGITVNAYAPGGIDTDMLGLIASESAVASGSHPEDYLQALRAKTPMGRVGETTDVANVVSFLASKESQFITGQSISVNGGLYFD
ncbi:hypothetical protein MSAN_00165900 [Mycena sanguinolenta]|uniref:Ketoreductase domain-containing protein n=1 Tax=Mycena sanguinolenta TaxID=230812 RepID=A0A8H7DL40_9AGAR|nr:hypothetical protein MSAN_00165900 [Mycena sanguinolenta]